MQPVNPSSEVRAFAPVTPNPSSTPRTPVAATPETEPAQHKISAKEVKEAAQKVQEFVKTMSSDLQFSVDESSGSFVVKVVDRATQDVIRQIPSEEMLAISKALERLQGLLIKQQA